MNEETYHTRNDQVNEESIAIVLAGDFNREEPTEAQRKTLTQTMEEIQRHYGKLRIIGHQQASPTQCPSRNIMEIIKAL